MPLNPAFSLGPNTAFSGSLDVFSVQNGHQSEMDSSGTGSHALFDPQQQQHQHQHQHQQHQHQHRHQRRHQQQEQEQQQHQHQQAHQQAHQHPHPHQHTQQAASLAAPEMAFDLSSSTASTDTCSLGDALSLDLAHHGFFTGCNDYYSDWPLSDSAGYGHTLAQAQAHAQAHALDTSQWDATTVWSDASSSLLDSLALDEAVMESGWATNFLDPAMCVDAYDQHCMLYGQDLDQTISRHHARSGKHIGKSAFLSY
ncbi:hypothetical protein E4U55_004454 [Claviceps digitariae]|nr:hypothetical protein E4U55_004454 [Claviceps digitariae]